MVNLIIFGLVNHKVATKLKQINVNGLFCIIGIMNRIRIKYREAAKKVHPLVARPLNPYPPPLELFCGFSKVIYKRNVQ